jgi:hypothetical protein
LNLAKTWSIGLRSGEYFGKNTRRAPTARIALRTAFPFDEAEKILDRQLNSDDPRESTAAAFFVLRNAKRAVSRGWRQPDVEVAVNNSGPPVRVGFRWAEGTHVATVEYPAGTRIPRRLEIEHDPRDAVAAVEKPGG